MWKIAVALLAVAAAVGLSKSVAHSESNIDTRPVVYVVNHSHVPQWKLNEYLPVFQAVIDEDLGPVWSVSARLEASQTPAPGSMVVYLKDGINVAGAAGFHAVSLDKHVSYAQVDTSLKSIGWDEIFTHELEEMLVDPYIDRMSGVIRCSRYYGWNGGCKTKTFFYVEVSDAVEATRYDYVRYTNRGHSVRISDFVTPAWYSNRANGPFDFKGHVARNHQVLPGGYIYYCKEGDWDAITRWYHAYSAPGSTRATSQ